MNKLRVLVWSDSVEVSTGFGIVTKHILKALYATGKYEIDQLAINYFGRFYDKEIHPYQLVPARLLDPHDPYGNRMLLRSLNEKKYDILFIINDTYVTNNISKEIAQYKSQSNPNLKIIYYFPIDCTLQLEAAGLVQLADKPITYTNFAKNEVLKTLPQLADKLEVIYHGTDVERYYPLPYKDRARSRRQYFNIQSDDTFVFININRNSVRKNLAQTILAFSEFKKRFNRKCMLYLHTVAQDQGINLIPAINSLGLSTATDVIFPVNYNSVDAFPDFILNEFYNASDCFITTSIGEGWGMTTTEALASGKPVIAGCNTSAPEILATDRGFMYPMKEKVYVDASGYRPIGLTEDIANLMLQVANINKNTKLELAKHGRQFTETYSWKNIGDKWVNLFNSVEEQKTNLISTEVI